MAGGGGNPAFAQAIAEAIVRGQGTAQQRSAFLGDVATQMRLGALAGGQTHLGPGGFPTMTGAPPGGDAQAQPVGPGGYPSGGAGLTPSDYGHPVGRPAPGQISPGMFNPSSGGAGLAPPEEGAVHPMAPYGTHQPGGVMRPVPGPSWRPIGPARGRPSPGWKPIGPARTR